MWRRSVESSTSRANSTATGLVLSSARLSRWGMSFEAIDHVWQDDDRIEGWAATDPFVQRLREESDLYSQ
jgi:hypothetical protein